MGGINLAELDIIKESIEYEQLFNENSSDTVLRGEYLVPDTHPDVSKILMVEAKPVITSKEVLQERVYLEGQIEYNVIYLAREEEGMGTHTVAYNDKFSNYIDVAGAEHKMICDAECEVEHINVNIINERKINLEGVLSTRCNVYKKEEFDYVKDIESSGDVEMKKKVEVFDKVICNKNVDMIAKSHIQVSMDKPQIGKVIKCDVMPHKKEIKLSEDKAQLCCFCKIDIVYKAADSRELIALEDDMFISREEEIEGITNDMIAFGDFRVIGTDCSVGEDDLGEARVIDVESLIDGSVKIVSKESVDVIEDAYSPSRHMELSKKKVDMTLMHGQGANEIIVKDNVEPAKAECEPIQIINCSGKVVSLEKKIVDNKVLMDGIVKVNVIYKCSDNEMLINKIDADIPFTTSVDIQDAKPDMKSMVKAWLENIQASIEAHTIAIKAIISTYAKVFSFVKKECVCGVEEKEGEKFGKKASITIYAVQKGDSLWDLAKKFSTTTAELLKINNLDGPESICQNQKLIIPGRAII